MIRFILMTILSCAFLTSCVLFEKESKAIVKASKLNIRQKPTINGSIIGQLNQGDTVLIESFTNEYAFIQTSNATNGFVSKKHIKPINRDSLFLYVKENGASGYWVIFLMFFIPSLILIRLMSFILYKLSSIGAYDAPGFEFALTHKNGFFNRKFNSTVYLLLGRKHQHPYLNYWVYTSLYWVVIPLFFMGFIVVCEINEPDFFWVMDFFPYFNDGDEVGSKGRQKADAEAQTVARARKMSDAVKEDDDFDETQEIDDEDLDDEDAEEVDAEELD